MAKPSDYPGFKQLLQDWNKKLSDSGFKDQEYMSHGELSLKESGSARRYKKLDPITREAKIQHFRRLQGLVAGTAFDDEFEQLVLNLYAQGVTQAAIYRVMNVEGHRCKVYRPIYKWLKAWGLK